MFSLTIAQRYRDIYIGDIRCMISFTIAQRYRDIYIGDIRYMISFTIAQRCRALYIRDIRCMIITVSSAYTGGWGGPGVIYLLLAQLKSLGYITLYRS